MNLIIPAVLAVPAMLYFIIRTMFWAGFILTLSAEFPVAKLDLFVELVSNFISAAA